MVANAVFLGIGDIPVSGAIEIPQIIVGGAVGVCILDEKGNGRPGGLSLKNAGQDGYTVCLASWRSGRQTARPAPVQFDLDVRIRQVQTWRAAIDNGTDGRAVGFSPGGHTKKNACGVA